MARVLYETWRAFIAALVEQEDQVEVDAAAKAAAVHPIPDSEYVHVQFAAGDLAKLRAIASSATEVAPPPPPPPPEIPAAAIPALADAVAEAVVSPTP